MNNKLSLESAAFAEGMLTPAGVRYHVTDHLGSVRAVVDGESGAFLEAGKYDAYGSREEQVTEGASDATLRWHFTGKEDQGPDFGTAYTDFGARQYSPALRRWLVPDPLSEKYYDVSPYVYCNDNPVNMVDPDGRDGVLIVFPDYEIHVGRKVYKNLGHAGVLLINNKTGYTRYYEYGRYDSENKGIVRNYRVSDVKINENGEPTKESLEKVLKEISDTSGQGGRIEGAYIKSDEFDLMKEYAEQRLKSNNDPHRKGYSLFNNNCAPFATEVLSHDQKVKEQSPLFKSPRPTQLIKQFKFRK